jgi:tetratricopeptide (TPR) repeat protein
LSDNQKYEYAVSDLSKAIELFPEYSSGFFNRSHCYIDSEKYYLAILDLEKAHSIDIERHNFELLGFAYANINDHAKAIENYSLFLLDYVDNEVSKWKAFSHICLNQLQEALKEYESILLTEIVDMEKVEKINEISNDIIYEELVATDSLAVIKMIIQIGFLNNTNNCTSGIYILQFSN